MLLILVVKGKFNCLPVITAIVKSFSFLIGHNPPLIKTSANCLISFKCATALLTSEKSLGEREGADV